MLPRPLLLTGCFLLAVFAGKAARDARVRPVEAQAGTPEVTAPSVPPMPEGMDDLATRIWLAENLPDASSERMREIATRLVAMTDLDERAWEGLFSRWFEMDPAAAWAFAAGNENLRPTALEEWAAIDPDAASKEVIPTSGDDLPAVIRGALRKDVMKALPLIDQGLATFPGTKKHFLDRFIVDAGHFAELASRDPDAAVAWAEKLEVRYVKGALLWGRWKHDPDAARAWLSAQEFPDLLLDELAGFADDGEHYLPSMMDFLADAYPPGNGRMEAIQRVLEGLVYRDPEFAAKEATRVIRDERLRAEAICKIAMLVAKQDFAKAWSLLETLDPSIQGIQRIQIPEMEFRAGSETDRSPPPFRYQWDLRRAQEVDSPSEVRCELLDNLMETDKKEAIRLMESIPSGDLFRSGSYAFWMWANRDYQEAVRWLDGKLSREGGTADLEGIIDLVDSGASPEEMTALIDGLSPGTVRNALTAVRASELAESDPLAALELARAASTADEAITRAYMEWSSSDPLAALEHLASDAEATPGAWEEVVEESFKKSPEDTARAIESLPESPARDAAIAAVLESLPATDPLAAGAWALALGDASKRKAAIEKMLGKLTLDLRLMRDPATAEELQQQVEDAANLSDAERQRWLERIDFEFSDP